MRRRNGTGHVKQRANGTWEGRFIIGRNRITWKPIQKSVYGPTREDVEEKLKNCFSTMKWWRGLQIESLKCYCSHFLDKSAVIQLIEKWRERYYRYEFDTPEVDGFVYFVTNGTYVKIGCAIRPELRLKELQCGTPDKLEILFTIPVGANSIDPSSVRFMYTLEHQLHLLFENYKVRNEWFDIPKRVIEDGIAYYGKYVEPGRTTFNILAQKGICKQRKLYEPPLEPRRAPMTYNTNALPEWWPLQTLRECCRRTGLKQKVVRDAVNAGKVEYQVEYGKVTLIVYDSLLKAIERGDIA